MAAREPRLPPRGQASRVQSQQPGGAWRISIALFVSFCAAVASLHTVLESFEWWFAIATTVLVVLGSAAVARAVTRRGWVPQVVAPFAFLGVLTLMFSGGTALLFVIATPETFGVFEALAREGSASIGGQSIPAEATQGIVFLMCLGMGALAFVGDLIAVSLRRPALAGVPLAVIVGIPTVIGYEVADTFILILTAICWLILLRAGQPFPQTARTFSIGAFAVAIALVVPLVLPPVVAVEGEGNGANGGVVKVNPVLSLGRDLRRELPRTVLTYNTRSGAPAYLRLVSLQNFSVDTWAPDPTIIDLANVPSTFRPPPGLAVDVPTTSETTWVNVENLASPWLPTPYPPTGVSGLRGNWYWDAAGMTFTSTDSSSEGEQYRVASLILQPTPAQLAAAKAVLPADMGAEAQKYLALPEGMPSIIGETALAVTASADSDYARAVALQEYFRNGQFIYSETTPLDDDYDSNGMLAIAKFLEVKSGYCIHFASSMAVMARTLGIPSRVTVGFLPGEKQTNTVEGRTSYRVSTQDVHAWPELYFEGIGWTRFEPTTSRGFVPTYADEATPGVPITPNVNPTPTASPSPSATPQPSAAPVKPNADAANPTVTAGALGWLWGALIVLGIALLLLVPAAVRAGQRALRLRRLARGHPIATTGWRELLQSAHDLKVDISPSATPREAAAVIERAAKLGDSDRATLQDVLGLVERQSFAGESSRLARGTSAVWPERVKTILARLRSAATWRTRVAAALAPPSMWSRLRVSRDD